MNTSNLEANISFKTRLCEYEKYRLGGSCRSRLRRVAQSFVLLGKDYVSAEALLEFNLSFCDLIGQCPWDNLIEKGSVGNEEDILSLTLSRMVDPSVFLLFSQIVPTATPESQIFFAARLKDALSEEKRRAIVRWRDIFGRIDAEHPSSDDILEFYEMCRFLNAIVYLETAACFTLANAHASLNDREAAIYYHTLILREINPLCVASAQMLINDGLMSTEELIKLFCSMLPSGVGNTKASQNLDEVLKSPVPLEEFCRRETGSPSVPDCAEEIRILLARADATSGTERDEHLKMAACLCKEALNSRGVFYEMIFVPKLVPYYFSFIQSSLLRIRDISKGAKSVYYITGNFASWLFSPVSEKDFTNGNAPSAATDMQVIRYPVDRESTYPPPDGNFEFFSEYVVAPKRSTTNPLSLFWDAKCLFQQGKWPELVSVTKKLVELVASRVLLAELGPISRKPSWADQAYLNHALALIILNDSQKKTLCNPAAREQLQMQTLDELLFLTRQLTETFQTDIFETHHPLWNSSFLQNENRTNKGNMGNKHTTFRKDVEPLNTSGINKSSVSKNQQNKEDAEFDSPIPHLVLAMYLYAIGNYSEAGQYFVLARMLSKSPSQMFFSVCAAIGAGHSLRHIEDHAGATLQYNWAAEQGCVMARVLAAVEKRYVPPMNSPTDIANDKLLLRDCLINLRCKAALSDKTCYDKVARTAYYTHLLSPFTLEHDLASNVDTPVSRCSTEVKVNNVAFASFIDFFPGFSPRSCFSPPLPLLLNELGVTFFYENNINNALFYFIEALSVYAGITNSKNLSAFRGTLSDIQAESGQELTECCRVYPFVHDRTDIQELCDVLSAIDADGAMMKNPYLDNIYYNIGITLMSQLWYAEAAAFLFYSSYGKFLGLNSDGSTRTPNEWIAGEPLSCAILDLVPPVELGTLGLALQLAERDAEAASCYKLIIKSYGQDNLNTEIVFYRKLLGMIEKSLRDPAKVELATQETHAIPSTL